MVRSQTLPFTNHAVATAGQLTWVWLNQLVDYDERVRKIHVHCLAKFHQERCEVCYEPIISNSQFSPEIQDKIYKPGEDEVFHVEVTPEQIKQLRAQQDGNDKPEEPEKAEGQNIDLGEILIDP